MSVEKTALIEYQGNTIAMFADDRDAYVNLTHLASAWKNRKTILTWIRNRQTIEFLSFWETRYNKKFSGAQMSTVLNLIKERSLSIKQWVDLTDAKGIFTRGSGVFAGTYAHKDIALKFAAWLSPELELFIFEKIQELIKLEKQKSESELLTHAQIIELVKLKEVFKYVANQEIAEDAHKDIYASKSNAKNPYADFNSWRNKILEIDRAQIDQRILDYCEKNHISLKSIAKQSKKEKILVLDSYETVKHAVWDFLTMKGEINALNEANLVRDIIKAEKGEVLRKNEDNLFHQKQDLGEYSDFSKQINESPEVVKAREFLERKESQKKALMAQAVPMQEILNKISGSGQVSPIKDKPQNICPQCKGINPIHANTCVHNIYDIESGMEIPCNYVFPPQHLNVA
jgi:hypothetical protein